MSFGASTTDSENRSESAQDEAEAAAIAERTPSPEGSQDEETVYAAEELSEAEQLQDTDSDVRIVGKLRAQGVRLGSGNIAPRVFWPALSVIVLIAAVAMIFPDPTGRALQAINDWIVSTFGWYYMLVIAGFIVFSVFIGLSRFGTIKLGNDDDKPEFSWLTWFCMLFAAGMGIGLVFYGVGEPLSYASFDPKPGWSADPSEQAGLAMAQSFVHWGLHPWSIYAVIGLGIAYAIHRRGRPISIRWALEPLFGKAVKGWVGDLIDILAIFGTLFGIATSLGLGVQQIAAGMRAIGIVETVDITVLIVLIVVITFIALGSVVSGVGKGMKWLSNINLSLAAVFMITILVMGPTLFLLRNFVESLGVYLANLMNMTFDTAALTGAEGQDWNSTWTLFYWGWWIAWAPFVGVFIARVSRGRTIREFVIGVLLVPTAMGMLWLSVLGGTAIHRQLFTDDPLVPAGESVSSDAALFDLVSGLPMGGILSVAAIILVAIFFVTSSDSGSLVIDMLASGGHPNPPTWSRVLWGTLEGLIAIALLWSGGLEALQAASLATALPFSVVLVLMCLALFRALREEMRIRNAAEREARIRAGLQLVRSHIKSNFDEDWGEEIDTRVDNRIDYRLTATKSPLLNRREAHPKQGTAQREPAKRLPQSGRPRQE
ncbi:MULTISPECIES: BCCT family transporter [Brevibacterium]|uniref:BCCT family transporter n=1 Tax=Brevibacterium salitolerans TaxID=1403566 RepID=A0ABN2WQK7_9MICO|nr:BCCT family transporter [Brevibacterium sp.]